PPSPTPFRVIPRTTPVIPCSDPESAQQWLPVLCILYPMAHEHGHGTLCPYDLTPHSSPTPDRAAACATIVSCLG
ncbi:MAG: hypothetical protein ORN28_03645, partial [Rhodoferax sp.]|nr:hypothetical protein [Rhodoferax sp.]